MTLASSEAGRTTAALELAERWLARSDRAPSRALRRLTVVTAVATYLLIVVGGVVRTSGSGLGCGESGGRNDWPFCQGGLLPPREQHAVIEFSHRWLAAIVVGCAIALLGMAWTRYRHLAAITWTSTFFTVFLVIQVVLGAITVYAKLPGEVVMTHLANAELLLGCALLLIVLAFTDGGRGLSRRAARAGARVRSAAMWTAAAAVATYLLVISGAFVVARGAGGACAAWPLCGDGFDLDSRQLATYNLGHRGIAVVVTVLLGLALLRAARAHRNSIAVRATGAAVVVLLLAQVVAGAVLVSTQLPPATRSVHEALASALWAAVILLALLTRPGMLDDARAATAGAP